jgi:multidrug efflux pump subunit AcrA (membrane-fusion protein)
VQASTPLPTRPRSRWQSKLAIFLAVLAALILAAAAVPLLGNRGSTAAEKAAGSAEKPPVMVTVAPVELKPIQRTVETVGSFQGFEEVAVTPKVSGRVIRVHHNVQDIVHTGDLLLEIDQTDYQLAVDEARKTLGAELAKIGCPALPPETMDVKQFVEKLPAYRKALNVEQNAYRKLQRATPLRQTNAISQEDLEQITTDYEVAKAARELAEIEIMSTVASARQKQALLSTALQHLADTHVEVPVARMEDEEGEKTASAANVVKCEYVVDKRMVAEGEMVVASTFLSSPVYRLILDKKLKLFAAVPERYMSQVRLGQTVDIWVEAYPDRAFHGRVRRISPSVDRMNRTFQVEIHVPNEDRALRSNGFAKLAIITQSDARALAVPLEAVVSFAGVNKVFVIRDGKAHAIEVALGIEGRDAGPDGRRWVEVETKQSGELAPGTMLVTSGQTQLAEDVPAQVRGEK